MVRWDARAKHVAPAYEKKAHLKMGETDGAAWLRMAAHIYAYEHSYQTMKILVVDLCGTCLTNLRWWYNDLNKTGCHIVDEAGDEPLSR
jgi:hypothetical protein